ncbi:hypothetical protein LTR97_008137 [Elasticomyces elasticus]|uniref:Uncharacterized protein n=1 Tax=Elasticomyces elasticus TaxID=574655 RepID=A0AAN7VPI4_9PEZI|nr:hypothetical protein LTR97_008137 [Elasticomyces elasticus]
MAEETHDASMTIPKAMIASFLINGTLVFAMMMTYIFTLVDYDSIVNSREGHLGIPYLRAFANSTNSIPAGAALAALIVVLQIIGVTTWMTSCSRQIWAFGRDQGFPFSGWITKVDRGRTHPVNALVAVWGFVVLICLITLGSSVAFNAINSVQVLAIVSTYLTSIACLLWRRSFGDPLPASPWTLGRAAIPLNMVAFCYCIFLGIFVPFPAVLPVTVQNFNWAPVIFIGVMLLSALYYQLWAKKRYYGPVVLVQQRTGDFDSRKVREPSRAKMDSSSPGLFGVSSMLEFWSSTRQSNFAR